jgi:hypothetical protein
MLNSRAEFERLEAEVGRERGFVLFIPSSWVRYDTGAKNTRTGSYPGEE